MIKNQNDESEQNSMSTDEAKVEQSGIETNSLQKESVDIVQMMEKRAEIDPQVRSKSKKKVNWIFGYLIISFYYVSWLDFSSRQLVQHFVASKTTGLAHTDTQNLRKHSAEVRYSWQTKRGEECLLVSEKRLVKNAKFDSL